MRTILKFFPHFFLFSCFCLLICSCKKLQGEGWTNVEGQAVDKYTGEPVPFAKIQVETTAGGFTPIPGSGTAKEKIADANGKFEFSFEAESENNYQLTGYLEDRYFRPEELIDLNAARKNKNLKLKLQPLAWAKIKIINEPPLDTAWLHFRGFHNDRNGHSFFELHSFFNDTIIIRQLYGNKENRIITEVNKLGQIEKKFHYLYFAPFDTTVFEFRY